MPMFADVVYQRTLDDKKVEFKGARLGVIQEVRQITGSTQFVVTIVPEFTTTEKVNVYFQTFALESVLPQCKNANQADVIATFISKDGIEGKQYRMLVKAGAGTETFEITKANLTTVLANAMKTLPECPGEMIDGKCQERLEQAVLQVGQMPDFRTYLKSTAQFQMDFAASVGDDKDWVPAFSAFFIVDERSFNALATREKALRNKLLTHKDQCTAQFLLNMHRAVFETYLMQLNDMWQQPNMTPNKIVAIMWLLYYTQLPVFVFKLLEMMVPISTGRKSIVARLHPVIKAFHTELLKHLASFLPVRDATNDDQRDIVDNVRKCLEQIRVGVQEQMSSTVERQTPECL